ncbi:MAG: M23 family metallopeptidase [Clostridia bacterium]
MKTFFLVLALFCLFTNKHFYPTKNIEDTAIEVSLSFGNFVKESPKVSFVSVIQNPIITKKFGKTTEDENFYTGINVSSFTSFDVLCVADGSIIDKGYDAFFGNYIKILHENGYQSFYANLLEINDVNHVAQGDIIGKIGNNSNILSSHIYLEITLNDEHIDPLSVIDFYEN